MKQINSERVEHELTQAYGINLSVYNYADRLEIRLADLESGEGFKILVMYEWRHLSAEFIPDTFSRTLIRTMGYSNSSQKDLFKNLSKKYGTEYNGLEIKINDQLFDPLEPEIWPKDWSNLYIKLLNMPVILDNISLQEFENFVVKISGELLCLVLALLPIEETYVKEKLEGIPEGGKVTVEVNRYERSALNRQVCISIHGTTCKVCNFDFAKVYGSLGNGFIHVHHIVPVSKIGPAYIINPATDLVPLCPNCHAMVHKQDPPLSVEELKLILFKQNIALEKKRHLINFCL